MAQPLTNTPAVNSIVRTAQDLPDLVDKLQQYDPAVAQQITGKALLASKSAWGTWLVPLIAYLASKYGLGWDDATDKLIAGAVLIAASFLFRKISTAPITSWFFQRKDAPMPSSSQPARVAASLMAILIINLSLVGCASIQSEAGKVNQLISQNAVKIGNYCTAKILPVLNSPATAILLAGAGLVPYGNYVIQAAASTKATCDNIAAASASASTVPWLESQLNLLLAGGTAPPPAPIAPAPITAATVLPAASTRQP